MLRYFDSKLGKAVYPWLICMLPMLLAVYCCIIKSGGFVDEYFSLGFSNSIYGGYLIDSFDGNLLDKVITHDELENYIMVDEGEAFTYRHIFRNCGDDLTPPLYYCILHTICSFFPGTISKWFGLSMNLVTYFITLLFLYHSSFLLHKSRWVSALITICYGFSMGGMNCATYIRMYGMVTMWTVMLLFFIIHVIQNERKKFAVVSGIVIYLGFLTQYNFGIPAFFLCAATCGVLLYQKRIKQLVVFGISGISGAILFLLTWSSLLVQAERIAPWEHENGKGDTGLFLSLYYWCKVISKQIGIELIILCVLIIGILILKYATGTKISDLMTKLKGKNIIAAYVILLTGYIFGTIVIAYFAPYFSARYCFNTMPVFAMLLGLPLVLFKELLQKYFEKKDIHLSMNTVGAVIALLVIISAARFDEMKYLYLDNPEKLRITESVASHPCLFVNTNHDKSLINSIDHLIKFNDFYVTDDPAAGEYKTYLEGHSDNEAVVVFVDTDPVGGSGLDSDEVIGSFVDTGLYDTVFVLYELDSAKVFLLCNNDTVQ